MLTGFYTCRHVYSYTHSLICTPVCFNFCYNMWIAWLSINIQCAFNLSCLKVLHAQWKMQHVCQIMQKGLILDCQILYNAYIAICTVSASVGHKTRSILRTGIYFHVVLAIMIVLVLEIDIVTDHFISCPYIFVWPHMQCIYTYKKRVI